MSFAYTITDTIGDNRAERLAGGDVADTVRPWFPEAPAEVSEAIDRFGDALARGAGDDRVALFEAQGWAEYLGLTYSTHDE